MLFGGKPLKKVIREINEVNGIKEVKPVKRFRPSNGNYASTKRTNLKVV